MAAKLFIAVVAVLISAAAGEQIKYCGSQPYYPSQYTCYNGFLCPVVQGERSLKCGNACYLKEAYSIAAINGKPVNACGNLFIIGGKACVYCPFDNCADFTNTTLLTAGGGAMQVEVPGGQQTYIQSNGEMGFTQAHSAELPPGAVVGYWAAYKHGYFQNTRSTGWIACPQGAAPQTYHVFAKLEGLSFGPQCVDLNIITVGSPSRTFGAWQYI